MASKQEKEGRLKNIASEVETLIANKKIDVNSLASQKAANFVKKFKPLDPKNPDSLKAYLIISGEKPKEPPESSILMESLEKFQRPLATVTSGTKAAIGQIKER